jgi:hypothetical protein
MCPLPIPLYLIIATIGTIPIVQLPVPFAVLNSICLLVWKAGTVALTRYLNVRMSPP